MFEIQQNNEIEENICQFFNFLSLKAIHSHRTFLILLYNTRNAQQTGRSLQTHSHSQILRRS